MLSYVWSVVAQPEGSRAWFSNAEAASTLFFADASGDYEIELRVHDGRVAARPDRVSVHVPDTLALNACLYLPMQFRR